MFKMRTRYYGEREADQIRKENYLRYLEGYPEPDFSEITDIRSGTIRSGELHCWHRKKDNFDF